MNLDVMKNIRIPTALTVKVGRAILKTKKNSPHIFFAAGVVGVAGTVVLACKATLKVEKEVDKMKEELDDLKSYHVSRPKALSEREYKQEAGKIVVRGSARLAKMYAPAAVIGVASVAALTGSHIQLTRRNAALTATVGLVSKAFEDYRARVQEQIGEEKEADIHRGVRQEVVEGKDGKKEIQRVMGLNGRSAYARCFDNTNPYHENNVETNFVFLKHWQVYWQNTLNQRGHVFLNEVYESIGFDHTPAGAVMGWIKNSEDGDGFIDFDLFHLGNDRFHLGWEDAIWLDFNVDDKPIYDQI